MAVDIKAIANKVLDRQIDVDGESMTMREALISRIVMDAIGDEDPVVRGKAAALVLTLVDYDADRESQKPSVDVIVNKKGEKI